MEMEQVPRKRTKLSAKTRNTNNPRPLKKNTTEERNENDVIVVDSPDEASKDDNGLSSTKPAEEPPLEPGVDESLAKLHRALFEIRQRYYTSPLFIEPLPPVCSCLTDKSSVHKQERHGSDTFQLYLDIGPSDYIPLPSAGGRLIPKCCICPSVKRKNYLEVDGTPEKQSIASVTDEKDNTNCLPGPRKAKEPLAAKKFVLQKEFSDDLRKQEIVKAVCFTKGPGSSRVATEGTDHVVRTDRMALTSKSPLSISTKTARHERLQVKRVARNKPRDGARTESKFKPVVELVAPSVRNSGQDAFGSFNEQKANLSSRTGTKQPPAKSVTMASASTCSGIARGRDATLRRPVKETSAVMKPLFKEDNDQPYQRKPEAGRGPQSTNKAEASASSDKLTSCPLCSMGFNQSWGQLQIDEHIALCLSATNDDIVW